jgi:predicted nucleotidyltransferase
LAEKNKDDPNGVKQKQAALQKRYEDALMSFVEKVKVDRNVIAVFVYGSISHGTVWENSDTDVVVLVREQRLDNKEYALYEDNLQVNIEIYQYSDFKRNLEKAPAGSLWHGFGSTYRIVYTAEESLRDYIEEYKKIGKYDMEKALFFSAETVVNCIYKTRKWINVIDDLEYARYYALKNGANDIACMVVTSHFMSPTREAILQAAKLEPETMEKFFYKPMRGPMTKDELNRLADDMDEYLMGHYEALTRIADDCFGDGEMKTGTQITRYYGAGMHQLDSLMNYLCEKGYMIRVSQTIRLTPKSRPLVEETAYIKAI